MEKKTSWIVKSMSSTSSQFQPIAGSLEPTKPVISNARWHMILWHKWAVISISWSIVLIYANLAEYSFGAELRTSAKATANILGALQLAIKAHELTIASSLFVICQQWLHRILLDFEQGMPLGLLGAENEVARPSFLISKGYFAAVCYAGSLWGPRNDSTFDDVRRKRHVSVIALFLFLACVITSLAGPASGVLMIPRVDWFFEMSHSYPTTVPTNFPYLLGAQEPGSGQSIFNEVWIEHIEIGLAYWTNFAIKRSIGPGLVKEEIGHIFDTFTGVVHINTTLGRAKDNNSDPSTIAATVMMSDILTPMLPRFELDGKIGTGTDGFAITHADALRHWSARRYVTEGSVFVAAVACQHRKRENCPTPPPGNTTSPWCYTSLPVDASNGTFRISPNLILIAEDYDRHDTLLRIDRVYITEGPITTIHPNYADSIEVVFDTGEVRWDGNGAREDVETNAPSLTVCSISSSIFPAVITSDDFPFIFRFADYARNNSHTVYFHKNWLWAYREYLPDTWTTEGDHIVNITSLGRTSLQKFGATVVPQRVEGFLANNNKDRGPGITDIEMQEIIVAGAFAYLMSLMDPSTSQNSSGAVDFMEEDSKIDKNSTRVITVFNLCYGFRLSSRTSILGITVLLAHAVIVVLGSLWQLFWERKIILGWCTIPDYVALALGSDIPDELNNTCAGISNTQTLRSVVKVGETTEEHLEIALIERVDMKPVSSRVGEKYGSRVAGGKSQEKLE